MSVESLSTLNLGAASGKVVDQTDVECDLNQTQSSGSGQGHRPTSTQVCRVAPYSDLADGPDSSALIVPEAQRMQAIIALTAAEARRVQADAGTDHVRSDWYQQVLQEQNDLLRQGYRP